MANSLLDFVMSVVRDPEIAAQYAANPAQAIADADLSGVTASDVNNLIPVVAESFPSAAASTGVDQAGLDVFGDAGTNVWASGAATAAFDAFDDHLPVQGVDDAHAVVTDLVTQHDDILSTVIDTADPGVPSLVTDDDAALAFDAPVIDDVPVLDAPDWDHPDATPGVDSVGADHTPQSDPSGFDLFD
ncbi:MULTISPECIES: Rv0340 family IniB-related protein [unclassified Mycolicibacterium]|uniref:Rv0340 family IniB-related protein n=1 Tax=unclassified Mycolicibacterium TaxID=2636767 RepID=UPI001F4BF4BA|nr:Rv0340 family IniB-related protein [Mycolicibacterium sp. YH-1]UNB51953.1 Rv0340 family protein [Mycolicibacterium sp. YH-1]